MIKSRKFKFLLLKYGTLASIGLTSCWCYREAHKKEFPRIYALEEELLNGEIIILKPRHGFARNMWQNLKFSYASRLLSLMKSEQETTRNKAVKALSEVHDLEPWQCSWLACRMDAKSAIALARFGKCDSRLILDFPTGFLLSRDKILLGETMRQLLVELFKLSKHPCLGYFISKVFVDTKVVGRSFDDQTISIALNKTITSPDDIIPACLESLLHHCSIRKHSIDFVRLNGLYVLMELKKRFENYLEITVLLAGIMSCLSIHPELLEGLYRTGWIRILSEWLHHKDLRVSVPAAKALANFDSRIKEKYNCNLYVLHPLKQVHSEHSVDVVLVHGIWGGIFYTWRQRDGAQSEPINETTINEGGKDNEFVCSDLPVGANEEGGGTFTEEIISKEENENNSTKCWPKDWLAKDFPGIRVIGLNYYTSISQWAPFCPYETEDNSLEQRSKTLLNSLIEAHIGDKPIIWIAHSMGGLLVKNMLNQAKDSKDSKIKKLCCNSKAIIFYSTPHHGTSLANFNQATSLLLWPSQEVQDLRKDSPKLAKIHEKFLDIAKRNQIKVVSMVEGKDTTTWKVNMRLVDLKSGNPGIGECFEMPLDHLNICKPLNRKSFVYQKVASILDKITKEINL